MFNKSESFSELLSNLHFMFSILDTWRKPSRGLVKCNFDASLNAGAHLIGIGFVHNGVFVEARNGSIHGEMDAFSFHAEAIVGKIPQFLVFQIYERSKNKYIKRHTIFTWFGTNLPTPRAAADLSLKRRKI